MTVEAVDFLVTTDYTNITDPSHHFVARIVRESAIATARAEILKEEPPFMIISGIIQKETADWNPEWSFHLRPVVSSNDSYGGKVVWPI